MPLSSDHPIFEEARASLPADATENQITDAYVKAKYHGSNSDLARTESLRNSCLAADRNGVLRVVEHVTHVDSAQTTNAPREDAIRQPPWSDEPPPVASPTDADIL